MHESSTRDIAILLVDDHAGDRAAICAVCVGAPGRYHIDEVADCELALARLAVRPYDVVLLSATLFEGARRRPPFISALWERYAELPVILLTPRASAAAFALASLCAADDCRVKRGPALGWLPKAIRLVVNQARRSRELRRLDARLAALDAAALAVHGETDAERIYAAAGRELARLGLRMMLCELDQNAAQVSIKNPGLHPALHARSVLFAGDEAEEPDWHRVAEIPAFHQALESGEPVFLEDAQDVMAALLPHERSALAPRIREFSSGAPAVVVPLALHGRWRLLVVIGGALNFSEVRALSVFVHQIGAALEQAHLLGETRQHAFEQETLNSLADAVGRTLEVNEIVPAAMERILAALDAPAGLVLLANREATDFERVLPYGLPEAVDPVHALSLTVLWNNSALGYAARTGEIIVLPPAESTALVTGLNTLALVPLPTRDRPLGVLALGWPEARAVSGDDLRFVRALAGPLANALEHARLFDEVQRRVREIERLYSAQAALSADLSLDAVLDRLSEQLVGALNVHSCTMLQWDRERDVLVTLRDYETLPGLRVTPGQVFPIPEYIRRVLRERRPQAVSASTPWLTAEDRAEIMQWQWSTVLHVAFVARDQVTGLIEFGVRHGERMFTHDELRMAQNLANHAAIAIEHAQLYRAAQLRLRQLESLREIGLQFVRSLDRAAVLETIAASVQRSLHADLVLIFLYEGASRRFVTGGGWSRDMRMDWSNLVPGMDGMNARVVRQRRRFVYDGLRGTDDEQALTLVPELSLWEVQSVAALPLLTAGHVAGVLNVCFYGPHDFARDEVQFLELLADQAAVAIENAQLFNAQRARAAQQSMLYHISQTLVTGLELRDLMEAAVLGVQASLRHVSVSVFLLAEDRESVSLIACTPDLRPHMPSDYVQPVTAGVIGRAVRLGQTQFAPDTRRDPDFFGLSGWHPLCELAVPFRLGEQVVGVLNVESERLNALTLDDVLVLETVAGQVASAVERARLFMAVRSHAEQLEARVAERTAEIRAQKERTEAILRSVADAVIVVDLAGAIVLTNPMADSLLSGTAEHEAGLSAAVHALLARRAQGALPDIPETIEADNVVLEAHAVRVAEDDQPVCTVLVLRDVTRRHELDRMKSQFVSTVSHELRTPLSNIKLYLVLLQKGRPEKQKEYLGIMEREVVRLERLIDALLDLARLERTREPAEQDVVELDDLLATILPNHMAQAEVKHQTLTHVRADVPLYVLGDRNQLIQVFTNLIGNASLYTPESGRIEVRGGTTAAEGERPAQVWVAIQDSGIGIPPEDLTRVFDRFYRSPQAELSGVRGSGLGLAIVREIVGLHGGQIEIQSSVGHGSTFTVILPAHTVAAPEENA